MLDIIRFNPYRVLGVYANATKKDIVANETKIKAFVKVGKHVTFPLDLSSYITAIHRTEQQVSDAEAQLTLPKERLKYGMFWFLKETPIDNIAFNHLFAGNINQAIEIWSKRDSVSSLQNRITCSLIKSDYTQAIKLASVLCGSFGEDFLKVINGESSSATAEWLFHTFLSEVGAAVSVFDMLDVLNDQRIKEQISREASRPYEIKVNDLIEKANVGEQTIEAAERLALDCSSYLGEIYALSKHYSGGTLVAERLSTKVGEQMLAMIIKEVNGGIETFSKGSDYTRLFGRQTLHSKFEKALQVLGLIRQLKLESSFSNGRLKEQTNVIKSLCDQTSSSIYPSVVGTKKLDLRDSRTCYLGCRSYADYRDYCHRYPYVFNHKEAWDKYDNLFFCYCKTSDQLKLYLSSLPAGNHITEVRQRLEELLFAECLTLTQYEEYLKLFPDGTHSQAVKDKIAAIRVEEKKKAEDKKSQSDKAASFTSLSKLVSYYNANRASCTATDAWANGALKLASTRKNFQLVSTTFPDTYAGREAKRKYDDLLDKWERKKRTMMRWIGIPLGVLALILAIGAISGNFLGTAAFVVYVFSILVGIAAFIGICGMLGGNDIPGCVGYLFLGLAVACAAPVWFAGDAISDYKKSLAEKSKILACPTIEACETYMKQHPNDKDKERILTLWVDKLIDKSRSNSIEPTPSGYKVKRTIITQLGAFAETYANTSQGEIARERFTELCDSLYSLANKQGTEDAWTYYQAVVPESEYRKSCQKLDSIQKVLWGTESAAWETASSNGKKTAYEKYLELYPNGKHKSAAHLKVAALKYGEQWASEPSAWKEASSNATIWAYERYLELYPKGSHAKAAEHKIVDMQVKQAEANGTALPKMDHGFSCGSSSSVSITNSTSHTMTLKYYGKTDRVLTIPAHSTRSITLPNGQYNIVASVSGGVSSYYGSEVLRGGSYSAEYYIYTSSSSTYRNSYSYGY